MRDAFSSRGSRVGVLFLPLMLVLFIGVNAPAQQKTQFVTPGPNVNVIGSTPNASYLRIPDWRLKQQHEPSCIVRPNNPAYILCAFNDMRAADWPSVQGDGWIGISESNDFGKTWQSRLIPGYTAHPYSISMGFAADPTLTAIPGIGTPGLAVLGYIASFRDSDEGVMAVQRFVEFNQEDGEFYKAEVPVRIAASGSEGRFIDKVASIYMLDDTQPFEANPTISETITAETRDGNTVSIPVTTPTGTLVIAYSVFTGVGNSVKIITQFSTDNGRTFSKPKKVSEELNIVTGVSLAHVPGQGLSLTYRRSRDSNETDAIVQAYSFNGGKSWSKSEVVFEICPFDQQASGTTFRNFTFPWMADDGNRFWVFSADRVDPVTGERIIDQGRCEQVPGAPPGTYPGVSRIVGMSSLDGTTWEGESATKPFILDHNEGLGYQVLPFAYGTKGRVDVAWWDTRREDQEDPVRPPPPEGTELPLIYDYMTVRPGESSFSRVFRTADIFMTRIEGCQAPGCTPVQPSDSGLESPVRVSLYDTKVSNGVRQEIQSNRLNLRTHASGTLAYNGDYGSIATPSVRQTDSGRWIQNSLDQQEDEDPATFVKEENVFVAWGDNRDISFDPESNVTEQREYSFVAGTDDPFDNQETPGLQAPILQAPGFQASTDDGDKGGDTLVAARIEADEENLEAVTEPDTDPTEPSAVVGICDFNSTEESRSRDTNVYASLVEDVPSLVTLTNSRRFNGIQRMFPLVVSNPSPDDTDPDREGIQGQKFCLAIMNQPVDYAPGRASFNPLPASQGENSSPPKVVLEVPVEPLSTAARSVFVTSSDESTVIRVNAYELPEGAESCPEPVSDGANGPVVNGSSFGPIVSTVQLSNGTLFDPEFCADKQWTDGDADNYVPGCKDAVADAENHNIRFASFESPGLQAPILQAPSLQAPGFQAPILQAPSLQAPGFQAPGFQAPGLQAPGFQAPGFQAESLASPSLQAPSLQASGFDDADASEILYQDVVFLLETAGNVTTTFSADIAVLDLDPDSYQVQLIAWQPNLHSGTAVPEGQSQCFLVPQSDDKVIASVDMGAPGLQAPSLQASNLGDVTVPTAFSEENQDPYAGEISFAGAPGDLVALTVRIWVTNDPGGHLAYQQLLHLQQCSNNNPDDDPSDGCSERDRGGIVKRIAFGAAAHGCSTSDVDEPLANVDCINAGAEKIEPPDLIPPVFSPNGGQVDPIEANRPDGAEILTPGTDGSVITATDNSGTQPTVQCTGGEPVTVGPDEAEKTFFAYGDTTVECTALDAELNEANAVFTISVTDSNAPLLTVPSDGIVSEATKPEGADVQFTASVDDVTASPADIICTASVALSTDGTSGTYSGTFPFFPLSDTSVTCSVTDLGGNIDEKSFVVTVQDTEHPDLVVPSLVTASVTDTAEATVTYAVSAADETGIASLTCSSSATSTATSGGQFPVGTTTVTCTATDNGGNTTIANFDVVVTDEGPPSIVVPAPITEEAQGPDGDTVSFAVSGGDNVDDQPQFACTRDDGGALQSANGGAFEGLFPLGTTTVTCTATDAAGNTAQDTFTVTVEDTTPPTVNVPTSFTATATDSAGAIIDFVSDRPITAEDSPPVTAAADLVISCTTTPDIATFDPRTQPVTFPFGGTEVSCTATDEAGNPSDPGVFTVTVELGATGVRTNKNNAKTGSSIPLTWAWTTADGTPVDIGTGNQDLQVRKGTCENQGELIFDEDPGSSGFQRQSDFSWQYNFQAVDGNGDNLEADNAGGGTPYCATIFLFDGPNTLQTQNGEFRLKP